MRSDSEDDLLMAAQGFRKILTRFDKPYKEILDAEIFPYLIDWIQRFDIPQLQYECAWIITNIASATDKICELIVDKGFVPLLIQLMNSTCEEVKLQGVWALANIGADSASLQDLILKNQGLTLLLKCLQSSRELIMIKKASLAISNLCQGKSDLVFEMVDEVFPVLADVINTQTDTEILKNTLWALFHLSEDNVDNIDDLITIGVVPRLIQLLNHNLEDVQFPAIKVVGNIAGGNDHQTQVVVYHEGVKVLATLIESSRVNVQREAVLVVSYFCASSKEVLDKVILAGLIPKIIACAYSLDKKIQISTVWTLSNAVEKQNPGQIQFFVQSGIIRALCNFFSNKNERVVAIAIEALNKILNCGKENDTESEMKSLAMIFEQREVVSNLIKLQQHQNIRICNKAKYMIETYFQIESH